MIRPFPPAGREKKPTSRRRSRNRRISAFLGKTNRSSRHSGQTAPERFNYKNGPGRNVLAFCPNCGAQVQPGAKFCPNCGAQLGSKALAPAQEVRTESTPRRSLPDSKRMLSLAQIIAGGLTIFFAGLVVLYIPGFVAFGVVVLLLALVSIANGYGTRKDVGWVKVTSIVTGLGYVLLGLLFMLTKDAAFLLFGVLALLLGGGTLLQYWLDRPRLTPTANLQKTDS